MGHRAMQPLSSTWNRKVFGNMRAPATSGRFCEMTTAGAGSRPYIHLERAEKFFVSGPNAKFIKQYFSSTGRW